MRLKITHTTTYRYDSPDHYALQQLRLYPKTGAGQTVREWQTTVTGGQIQLRYDDHLMNHVQVLLVDPGATEVVITSAGEVETEDRAGVVGRGRSFAPLWLFTAPTALTQPGPAVRKLVTRLKQGATEADLAHLHRLSAEIGAAMRFDTGATEVTTTAEAALAAGHGVCQDHTHVFISAARAMGVAARYVSGYLYMDGVEDQEATHAWAEAWVEPLGWIGFDIANGISPDDRYVRLATGRDYTEAAPIRGLRQGGGKETMSVTLNVQAQTTQ